MRNCPTQHPLESLAVSHPQVAQWKGGKAALQKQKREAEKRESALKDEAEDPEAGSRAKEHRYTYQETCSTSCARHWS